MKAAVTIPNSTGTGGRKPSVLDFHSRDDPLAPFYEGARVERAEEAGNC